MISAKDLKELSGSLNVLFAEDEAMLRDSMQSTLNKFFKNTFVASNGSEAFEIFKKEDIDIIITDINMPIMTGTELIQTIQKYTDQEPMIVVLSAHNEARLLTGLINMGVNYFLNKPLDKQLMINSLYKMCRIVNDKKLLAEYEIKLQNELEAMERKNKILQQKLNQLAAQRNKNTIEKEEKDKVSVETTSDDYYSTLLLEDKEELEDLSMELDNFIAMMFRYENLNKDYLPKLANVYKKYASIINSHPEFAILATSLHEFSDTMLSLESKFMKDIHQTGVYLESLQMTLENYRQNIWNKRAKNPKFYNASLLSDIQLVTDFLQGRETQENEIEFF